MAKKQVGVLGLMGAFQGIGETLVTPKGSNPFIDIPLKAGQAIGGILPTQKKTKSYRKPRKKKPTKTKAIKWTKKQKEALFKKESKRLKKKYGYGIEGY